MNLQRALVLFEQSRPDLAEKELRLELAADPDSARAHALLALCLAQREEYGEAQEESERGIHLAPGEAFCHYVRASVLRARGRHREALASVDEAVRLDPGDPDPRCLEALIRIERREWKAALEAAERGLALDPEHVRCKNFRALALVQLGRREEAGEALESALAKDPEDALTHANQGWRLLHAGRREAALEHFKEALRLDPELDWARQGIVEALKAKNLLYAGVLRYFLWMSRLRPGWQWAIIVGGFFAYRSLASLAQARPALAPWIWPLLGAYLLFAFLTWTSETLFNLLLRLDRFGRLALSREELIASNWAGGVLAAALILSGGALLLGRTDLLLASLAPALLIIPLSAFFRCEALRARVVMGLYTAFAAAVLCAALLEAFRGERDSAGFFPYLILVAGSTWIGNLLTLVPPRK